MKTAIALAYILMIVTVSKALPVETELTEANFGSETTATTLLDVDQSAKDESGDDLKRTARGLDIGGFKGGFGGKFGGLGGHGLGGLGHGLGGLGHGIGRFGHGLGGLKKHFLF